MKYQALTLRQLIEMVNNNKDTFEKGLDTVIMSGDFEGNNLHEKHEPMYYNTKKYGTVIELGFEKHEDFYEMEKTV